jgi:hypothetical protein
MQFTKDSFYLALRDRLASLNPARLAVINGTTRIAIVVTENELISPAPPAPNTFYLGWKAPKLLDNSPATGPIIAMDCLISFEAEPSTQAGTDRGRVLSQLTTELLSICSPPHTRKRDFTQSPSIDLGTDIFWTRPRFDDPPADSPTSARLNRSATLTVFFFPELELS